MYARPAQENDGFELRAMTHPFRTTPENFIEFRGFFRDWQSVDCAILFFLAARLYRIYIMSNLMKTAEEFLSVRFGESDYGVLAVF